MRKRAGHAARRWAIAHPAVLIHASARVAEPGARQAPRTVRLRRSDARPIAHPRTQTRGEQRRERDQLRRKEVGEHDLEAAGTAATSSPSAPRPRPVHGTVFDRQARHRGSVSTAPDLGAPSLAAAMARMPEPVPRSSTRAAGRSRRARSSSTRQPRVLAWWPVPKAMPGSSTIGMRSAGALSIQGGWMNRRSPTASGGKCAFQFSAQPVSAMVAISTRGGPGPAAARRARRETSAGAPPRRRRRVRRDPGRRRRLFRFQPGRAASSKAADRFGELGIGVTVDGGPGRDMARG